MSCSMYEGNRPPEFRKNRALAGAARPEAGYPAAPDSLEFCFAKLQPCSVAVAVGRGAPALRTRARPGDKVPSGCQRQPDGFFFGFPRYV